MYIYILSGVIKRGKRENPPEFICLFSDSKQAPCRISGFPVAMFDYRSVYIYIYT